MVHRERVVLGLALTATLVAGCGPRPDGPSTSTSPAATTASPVATERPTAVPGEPAASLTFPGAGPIAGVVGSWAIDGAGSDAPWLPAAALVPFDLGPDAVVSVAFDDRAPIGAYRGSVAAVADVRGESSRWIGGRDAPRPPLGAVTLGPFPSGAWVLAVQLVRADGRGEATFYWAIRVP